MRILLVCPKNVTGVEYHRLLMPNAKFSDVTAIPSIDHQADSFFHDFDLIISSSVISKVGNQEILWKQLKRIGIPVIIDRDDTWILAHDHPMKKEWTEGKRAEQIIYNLKQANLVTTTNEYLANLIGNYNKKVEILPNGIDFSQPQFQVDEKVKELKTADMVHIGWSGSATHKQDIELLEVPLYELLKDESLLGKYRVILSGWVEGDSTWKYYEEIFTSKYKISVDHYARINAMDTNTYASAYDAMDVGLIPIRNTPFNWCKSNLKMLEMGAKKLAVVVSNEAAYRDLAINFKNCLLVNKKNWYKSIKTLIEDKELREDLAENLHEEVKTNWNIDKLNVKRLEVYQSLIK
jgi:glycosyltransferase involved in cell wall biosynthesis